MLQNVENFPLPEQTALDLLKKHQKTLVTAESCTGGLIAKRITDLSGASSAFLGGVVTYTNEMKMNLLGVPAQMLAEHSAVSAPVARAMAEGARTKLGADIALSVTGLAGPDGDETRPHIPVGTIYVGISTAEGTHVETLQLDNQRGENRIAAADCAFQLVVKYLTHHLHSNSIM